MIETYTLKCIYIDAEVDSGVNDEVGIVDDDEF